MTPGSGGKGFSLLDSLYAAGASPAGGWPALYAGMESRAGRRRGLVMTSHDNGSVAAAA